MSREPSIRQQRVADQILIEVGAVLQNEVQDPRIDLVTVTRVTVDRELDYANIWVCAVDVSREKEVLNVLRNAGGFIRFQLAQRLDLRKMPQLRFNWDPAPDAIDRVNRAIDALDLPPTPTDEEPAEDDE